ncbi:hypothetical protein GSI_06567 [Ganoderma sinense ZZ0214-1]|uniref:Ribonucleoside-diphosphate reductase n=1 Tax=Ganoderma sinense ZZ0214-1 TaxID=1077348 RepID=A0A2G8SDN5_9APHY|nr:hypothetical protein GSI_06567 [Ganoderma sinense ZZ0214-1]
MPESNPASSIRQDLTSMPGLYVLAFYPHFPTTHASDTNLSSTRTYIPANNVPCNTRSPTSPASHPNLLSTRTNRLVNTVSGRLPSDTIGAEAFLIFLAEIVSSFSSHHPDYSILAGRVYVTYHHKRVPKLFSAWVLEHADVFLDGVVHFVRQHAEVLDAAIIHRRDFEFTYRAMQMFERSYLLKSGRELVERLQFMFMRVAVGIHLDSVDAVLAIYDLLSTRKISFASPVLWNGGLANRHFASCYIFTPSASKAGDATGNFTSLSALWAADGGIGIQAGDVPATRSATNGDHPGLLPLLRVYDSLAAFWSRSSRHRSSSASVYLPVWHADVKRFVLSRTNRASSLFRFKHLFPALWVPNLFMRRVEADQTWSLFDPLLVPGLTELYGTAFETAYEAYEQDGVASGTISARMLWEIISEATRESGTPFLMYADTVNAKNNQMNLGVIKASNLCTEIVQYSSPIETAVCTLASLCLPRYIKPGGTFDYDELHRVTKLVVRALDRLVELTEYPTVDAAVAAFRTRSLGVGVQGLADVFAFLEVPFTSDTARTLNRRIFEAIYHAGLQCSCELAGTLGSHDSWFESPAQQGVLQIDMWEADTTGSYDFDLLRAQIKHSGLRNSMITAQMPTASTAQLFGNSEGIDPYISNVVQYRVLSGNFNEISRPLINSLQKRGLWSEQMRNDILACRGSVQTIPNIPDVLKEVFKTAFELDPRLLIDMTAERGPFIDQSQLFTLFIASPSPSVLVSPCV